MGPLKAYCNKEIRICVRNQEFIRLKNLAGIFKRAYDASSTAEIAISGFRKLEYSLLIEEYLLMMIMRHHCLLNLVLKMA